MNVLGCGGPNHSGVYAEVETVLNWVKENSGSNCGGSNPTAAPTNPPTEGQNSTTDSPNPWPLEIDMTYRLSNMYLIVTTIKNRGVVKRGTNEKDPKPEDDMTMMGPVFMCYTRNKHDYDTFLHALASELDKITPKNWKGKYLICSD